MFVFSLQFWCSCFHCWCFRRWTGVSMGTLTGLRLCSPYTTNCDALCILTHFYQNQHQIWATVALPLDWTIGPAFAPHVHQWALAAHDPVAGSPVLVPLTTFDRYCVLQTGNTPQELQFWRSSDPVIQPSQFGPCQICSNPYVHFSYLYNILKTGVTVRRWFTANLTAETRTHGRQGKKRHDT